MADQSTYTATNLPADGETIEASDVNTDLQGLIDEFNKNVGTSKITDSAVTPTKIATSSFKRARNVGTNATFNNTWSTLESVSITLVYDSILWAEGSCDARVADTTYRSYKTRIISTTSAVDTTQTSEPFNVGLNVSALRRGLHKAACFTLLAGTHTIKFQGINDTDSTTVSTDNTEIIVMSVPNK